MPETIYHYTTQEGLLGILKEKALWATKIQYLNDASELVESLRIVSGILEEIVVSDKEPSTVANTGMISFINSVMRAIENVNICVVSFCIKGDLLSQWRGYGAPNTAYSIGFDRKKLVESIREYPFQLRQCVYYEPAERRKKIQQYVTERVHGTIDPDRMWPLIGEFIGMAATIKLKCFQEEDEYRLISGLLNFDDKQFGFRPTKSMIIPYYSLPLDFSSIVEVVVGPCQYPELAKNVVHELALKFNAVNIQSDNVRISEIPYRVF